MSEFHVLISVVFIYYHYCQIQINFMATVDLSFTKRGVKMIFSYLFSKRRPSAGPYSSQGGSGLP